MDDPALFTPEAATALCARGRYAEALPALEVLAERHPGYADVQAMLGAALYAAGRLPAAETALRRALAQNPRHTDAALALAVLQNDRGDYAGARATYAAAVAGAGDRADGMDPFVAGKIANLHAGVAAAYRDAGQPGRAVEAYRQALGLRPDFADLRARLATVLMELGRWQDAALELTRAVASRPADLAARVRLGVCCYANGQQEEAVQHWQAVLDQEPHHVQAAMYLRMRASAHA